MYTVHKKFSTTRTCRVLLLFKIINIISKKFIIWLWKGARYDVKHPFLSSGVIARVKKWRYVFVAYTYIKCILVSGIVIWLGSRRITSPKMENAKNSFKIDVIRPVNLPLIQTQMTLLWISDETARRTGNNAKMGFLTDDNDLRDTIVKVRCQEFWYRTTESVKRQPVMTYVTQISKTFMNEKCHQTCVQGLIK